MFKAARIFVRLLLLLTVLPLLWSESSNAIDQSNTDLAPQDAVNWETDGITLGQPLAVPSGSHFFPGTGRSGRVVSQVAVGKMIGRAIPGTGGEFFLEINHGGQV